MSEAVDRLIAYCRENNRVCPLPKALRGGAATAWPLAARVASFAAQRPVTSLKPALPA
jgi:hypothetical protein